jgi:hypothetical protein
VRAAKAIPGGTALTEGSKSGAGRDQPSRARTRVHTLPRGPAPPPRLARSVGFWGVRDLVLKWLEDWHAWVDALFAGLFFDHIRKLRRSLGARNESTAWSPPAVPARVPPEPRAFVRTTADVSLTSDHASWGFAAA